MKRALWILLLIGGLQQAQAQIVSFNFTAGAVSVDGWTNVAGDPSTAVRSATGSGITVSSIATTNWFGDGGVCALNGLGAYPGAYFPYNVMSNAWFQNNGPTYNLALYSAGTPQLQLSGLNPDSNYIIRISSSNSYQPGPTQYIVAGATVSGSQDLDTYYNLTQGVTFQHVYPDGSGNIKVYVNGTATSQFAVISGLQVFPGSASVGTPAVSLTTPANGTIFSEGGNLTISATASETGGTITKVEFYADTIKIGEVDTAPYNFTWTDPAPGSYLITAKATDNVGTINTSSVNIAVESLNYFWSTTGNIATGGDTSFIGTVDSNRLAIRTRNIERMSILPTGNIGIGTITPSAQFHTTGSVRLAGLTSDSTKNRVLVSDTSGNLFYRNVSSLNRWQYAAGTVYDSVDNIGIGTSNTQGYKLAVNGTAIFTKVKVKTAGTWPDYVFKKGYALPDLLELERYIAANQHLPGILSEGEVQKDGIDVGAHAAAVLQKVEELTLYLIEENKKLKEQNNRLEQQRKEIEEGKARLEQQQQEIDELKKLIRKEK
jgi:hypothetical protein